VQTTIKLADVVARDMGRSTQGELAERAGLYRRLSGSNVRVLQPHR
jgi:hypothetical protein